MIDENSGIDKSQWHVSGNVAVPASEKPGMINEASIDETKWRVFRHSKLRRIAFRQDNYEGMICGSIINGIPKTDHERIVKIVKWMRTLPEFQDVPWDENPGYGDSSVTQETKEFFSALMRERVDPLLAAVIGRELDKQLARDGKMDDSLANVYRVLCGVMSSSFPKSGSDERVPPEIKKLSAAVAAAPTL